MLWQRHNEDELVYYASKEATVPRGRVALTECALGRFSESHARDKWSLLGIFLRF